MLSCRLSHLLPWLHPSSQHKGWPCWLRSYRKACCVSALRCEATFGNPHSPPEYGLRSFVLKALTLLLAEPFPMTADIFLGCFIDCWKCLQQNSCRYHQNGSCPPPDGTAPCDFERLQMYTPHDFNPKPISFSTDIWPIVSHGLPCLRHLKNVWFKTPHV